MKRSGRKSCLFLFLSLLSFSFIASISSRNQSTFPERPFEQSQEIIDLAKLFGEMKIRFSSIRDYSCEMQVYSASGKKTRLEYYNFYFKKPKQLRVEITGGENRGAVLLLKNPGNVRVRQKKGIGSLVTLSFRPDHPLVTNLRGYGLHQSDWGWFIDKHIELAGLFSGKFLREEKLHNRNTFVYELISSDPGRTLDFKRELLWVDDIWGLPLRYQMFDEKKKAVQTMMAWNIRLNTGLSDSLFADFNK